MDNKHISTKLGAAVLSIIAITVGVFVWLYEKGQDETLTKTALRDTSDYGFEDKEIKGIPTQLVISKPAEQWTKVCKNPNGGYQVKYPDEWTVKIGDTIQGVQIVENCDTPKLLKNKINTIMFSSLDAKTAAEKTSGITITAFPDSIRHSFVDTTQELIVDGEKMTWIDRNATRLLYHGTTEYNITINDDVSEDLVRDFFSTFKFLP